MRNVRVGKFGGRLIERSKRALCEKVVGAKRRFKSSFMTGDCLRRDERIRRRGLGETFAVIQNVLRFPGNGLGLIFENNHD